MKTYHVLYFGTWGYGRAGLEALLEQPNVNIAKVFTKWNLESDNIYLNQVYNLSIVNDLNLVNTATERMPKEDFNSTVLNSGTIDFIISCCYDRIFSTALLQFPTIGALNLHPSLLPKYRGIKPLENAIINQEQEMGVTLHELVKELDAGDIILQKAAPIRSEQTYGELYNQQCLLIRDIINEFFSDPEHYFNNKKPQNHLQKSEAPRLGFNIMDTDKVNEIIQKNAVYLHNH
ncbi:MAG: formyltransferase family protein [Saprospiraceae bacterium]